MESTMSYGEFANYLRFERFRVTMPLLYHPDLSSLAPKVDLPPSKLPPFLTEDELEKLRMNTALEAGFKLHNFMASEKSKLNDNTIRIMDLVNTPASATTAGDTMNRRKRYRPQTVPQEGPNTKRVDTRTIRIFCEDEIEACTMRFAELNLGTGLPLDDGGAIMHLASTLQGLVLAVPQPQPDAISPQPLLTTSPPQKRSHAEGNLQEWPGAKRNKVREFQPEVVVNLRKRNIAQNLKRRKAGSPKSKILSTYSFTPVIATTPRPITAVTAPQSDAILHNVNSNKRKPTDTVALKRMFSAKKKHMFKRMTILQQKTVDTYKRKVVDSISIKRNISHYLKSKKTKSADLEKLMRPTAMGPVSPDLSTTATSAPAPAPAGSTPPGTATTTTKPQAAAITIQPQTTAGTVQLQNAAPAAPTPAAANHTPPGTAAIIIQTQAANIALQAPTDLTEAEREKLQMIHENKAQMKREEIQRRLKREAEEAERKARAEKILLALMDVSDDFMNRPVREATDAKKVRVVEIPQEDDTSMEIFDQPSQSPSSFLSPSLSSTRASTPMLTLSSCSSLEPSPVLKPKRKFSIDLSGEERSDSKRSIALFTISDELALFADPNAYTEDNQDLVAGFVAENEHGDRPAPIADSTRENRNGSSPAPIASPITEDGHGSSSVAVASSITENEHGSSPAPVANSIAENGLGNGDGDGEPQGNADTAPGCQTDAEIGKTNVWNKRYRGEDEIQEAPETKRVHVSKVQEDKHEDSTERAFVQGTSKGSRDAVTPWGLTVKWATLTRETVQEINFRLDRAFAVPPTSIEPAMDCMK